MARAGSSRSTRRAMLLGACATAVMHGSRASPRAAERRPARVGRTFDPQRFIDECRSVAAGPDAQVQIGEMLARELVDCSAVIDGVGKPARGGLRTLYRSAELTILNIVWSPLMQLLPHDHNLWALIGIYTGREDNVFWRRDGARLAATNAAAVFAGSMTALPADVIHSVNNPLEKLTGAIHIYGGDFFGVHRSEWDPETLAERDWNITEAVRTFERANERYFGTGESNCMPPRG